MIDNAANNQHIQSWARERNLKLIPILHEDALN